MLKFIWSLVAPLLIRNTVMDLKTTAAVTTTRTAARLSFVVTMGLFVVGPMMVQPDPIIAEERKTQEAESLKPTYKKSVKAIEKVCGGKAIPIDKAQAWYDQQVVMDQRGNVKLMNTLKAHRIVTSPGHAVWPLGYCAEKPSETCWAGQQKAKAYYPGGVIYDGKKYGAKMVDKALDALFSDGKNGINPKKVNAFCI